jgi:4-amino-4-deoxy-L-arabinose transferase-like glycosyltransferase
MTTPSRRTITHLALLTLASLATYFVGLTDLGVANTQEMMRLTAAREMQACADLIVPTRFGEPYIAKPPVMYWSMIAIAELRGTRVGLFELRCTVALGGLLGVLVTYLCGRALLRDPEAPDEGVRAAWWGALGLASGVLYVRSSRMGELDILLIPGVVGAITCIALAWRHHLEHGRTKWNLVLVAALCSALAALTKGPVPTAVIGVGAYGAILADAAIRPMANSRVRAPWVGAAIGAFALSAISTPQVDSLEGALGVALFALVGGALGWGVARLTEPARARRALGALARTHPIIVLGAGFAALLWWLGAVEARVDPETLARLRAAEVDDNLRLLVPESPVNNLSFFAYGVGAASVACLIALFWIARDKPRLTTGRIVLLAWVLLGLVVFSTMGKGVARYLTPLWPATALLGGWWLVCAQRDIPRTLAGAHAWRVVPALIITLSFAINAWWYADGRGRFHPERSARALTSAMLDELDVDPRRVGAFGFVSQGLSDAFGLATHEGVRIAYWDLEASASASGRVGALDDLLDRLSNEPDGTRYWLLAARTRRLTERLDERGVRYDLLDTDALPLWVHPSSDDPVRVVVLRPRP